MKEASLFHDLPLVTIDGVQYRKTTVGEYMDIAAVSGTRVGGFLQFFVGDDMKHGQWLSCTPTYRGYVYRCCLSGCHEAYEISPAETIHIQEEGMSWKRPKF